MESLPMETADQQLRQQKENYEHMSEGELCTLAEEAYDLTDIAREALQAILSERGIVVRLKLEPPPLLRAEPREDDEGLINFKWPDNVEHAWRWMQILTAAGIPSFLGPDNVMHLEEFQGRFDGPVSLKIRDVDRNRASAAVARARELADQARTKGDGNKEEPEEEKNYVILCPKCRSAQVVMEGRDSELAEPPPTAKFQWRCDACGYQWMDDGIAQEAAGGQSWPGEEFPSHDKDSS